MFFKSIRPRWPSAITILYAATFVSMLSTVLIFVSEAQKNAMLATVTRTSGWVVYQAAIETVRSRANTDRYLDRPTNEELQELTLRLELLLSRLDILIDSEEGQALGAVRELTAHFRQYKAFLENATDHLEDTQTVNKRETAGSLQPKLKDLEQLLQQTLSTSIAYNKAIFEQEKAISQSRSSVPFLIGNLSGSLLLIVISRQSRRDKRQMHALTQAQRMTQVAYSNLRELVAALPLSVKVLHPETNAVIFDNCPFDISLSELTGLRHEWKPGAVLGGADADLIVKERDGQSRYFRVSSHSVIWDRNPALLFTIVDITDVRVAEQQLLKAAKLTVIGEIASSIVHEINQPLATIKLAAENAQRILPSVGGEPVRGKLVKIATQVDRAKRITDQVLAMGRIGAGGAEQIFSLRAALESALSIMDYQLESHSMVIDRWLDIPADAHLSGEQTMFEQVIVNLLLNSVQAFDEATIKADERLLALSAEVCEFGNMVKIELTDNAGGIPEAMLESIFEPFVTTKRGKGNGLGLALVRRVINQSGGSILARNVGGTTGQRGLGQSGLAGASFVIILPLQRQGVVNAAA